MDLPGHLRALPPGAVEVIRYLNALDMGKAGIDEICEEVGLSERGFGKAIRSLVTKGYVVMDGDQIYRLTEQGHNVVEEIELYGSGEDYNEEVWETDDETEEPEPVTRRLVLVTPRRLTANQPAHLIVGFGPTEDETPLEVVTRLSVLNGEPETPQEASFELNSEASTQDFLMTPGPYTQARIRVEVFQLGPNPDDITQAGGLYVDVDITNNVEDERVAYGVDVALQPQE